MVYVTFRSSVNWNNSVLCEVRFINSMEWVGDLVKVKYSTLLTGSDKNLIILVPSVYYSYLVPICNVNEFSNAMCPRVTVL